MWFASVLLRRVPQFMHLALRWKCGRFFGTRSGVWACEADGTSCGTFVLRTPEQQVSVERRHMHGTSGLPGVHHSGRKGVVPRRLCVVWGSVIARSCVWRDRDPCPVVLERVVAGLATTSRTGGRRRCGFAVRSSVAPVVHLVAAHQKDFQCAAVMHRSRAECARDGEKLKGTRRCCLLHLEGAPSASDDAGEEDAEAVVQAPVGVVVEWARVMGWRGTVDSVARGVRFWQLVRLGVAGRAWASLLGVLGAMWAGRGWLAGDASAVGVARVA